jgi:DNA-binding protein H-NS
MAKPTYQELKAQAAKLLAQAEEMRKEEIASVAKEVAAKLNEYEISLSDLKAAGYAFATPEAGPRLGKAKKTPTGTVAMKYRNPKNASNEWSGRGRTPKWMQDQLDSGKKKDDLLIR